MLGFGGSGRLGYGDETNRGVANGEMGDMLPAVDLGLATRVTSMDSGDAHNCVVTNLGGVKCWGSGGNGRLGYGDTVDRGGSSGGMGDNLPYLDLGAGVLAMLVSCGTGPHLCCVELWRRQVLGRGRLWPDRLRR